MEQVVSILRMDSFASVFPAIPELSVKIVSELSNRSNVHCIADFVNKSTEVCFSNVLNQIVGVLSVAP